MKWTVPTSCLIALLGAATSNQAAATTPAEIEHEIVAHLERQLRGLPGEASFSVGAIANPSLLEPCRRIEVETLPGARSMGRSSVRVRCAEGANLTMLVQVTIRVVADYVVTARPVSSGAPLQAADLALQRGDLGELPAGVLADPAMAVGRIPKVNLPAGRALRGDLLKEVIAVRNGQTVRVSSRGVGFEVGSQGTALNQAQVGDPVRVKLESGQIVSGRAAVGGIVEVIN